MADELDPRLETRLRDALRHEADAVPFTLTPADLEAARARRRSSRLRQLAGPASLLAAAAAVVLLVGIASLLRTAPNVGSATPDPLTADLASYAELEAGITMLDGRPIAWGEDLTGTLGPMSIGAIPANDYLDIVVACRGGQIRVSVRQPFAVSMDVGTTCDDRAMTTFSGAGFPTDGAEVVVEADPGTVWRVVVGGGSEKSPSPLAADLATFDELEQLLPQIERGQSLLARGENVTGVPVNRTTGETVIGGIPAYGLLAVAVDCRGGSIHLFTRAGGVDDTGIEHDCGDRPWRYTDDASDFAEVGLVVRADPGIVWRLVVGGIPLQPTARPSVEAPVGLPGFDELLARAQATVEVARAEGAAEPSDSLVHVIALGDRWNLEIAVVCEGPADLEILAPDTLDPLSTGTFACDGVPSTSMMTLLDAAAERRDDAAILARVPAGVAWRMVVLDRTTGLRERPRPPAEAFPTTLLGGYEGTLEPGAVVRIDAPPVPPDAMIEVAFGCSTGTPVPSDTLVRVTVDGVMSELACLEGNVGRFVPVGGRAPSITITSDNPAMVAVEARSFTQEQAGAAVAVPAAVLQATTVRSSADGVIACVTAYAIPGGASADEGCGPSQLVVPEARAVRLPAGEFLELVHAGEWEATGATITYVPSSTAGNATSGEPVRHPDPSGPGVEGGFTIEPLPAGDWTLRIDVSGRLPDGTTFTAQQLFRVIVGG